MQQENAIEVKNITKKFKVYYDKGSQLKERLLFRSRNRYEERKVLNDISFAVKKGEAVGLIGQNGCGKSTTLKLLTRIMYPDEGKIEISGRVSSLIELGAGFHPDMSGRENIYTNAAIFGLGKKEIDGKLDRIIRFSELGEYIDNPVRTYSSGMYMRLAFSVAINVDADILMIDEILAVGDAKFQAKCFNRLREIKAAGTTIVLVSHSTAQIEQICDKAIWIKEGRIEEEGTSRRVVQDYMSWIMGGESPEDLSADRSEEKDRKSEETQGEESVSNDADGKSEYSADDIFRLRGVGDIKEIGNREIVIKDYAVLDGHTLKPKTNFSIDTPLLIKICYHRNEPKVKEMMCSIGIYRSDGILCYTTNSLIDNARTILVKDDGIIELLFEPIQLMQGQYSIDLSLNVDYGPTFHGILNAVNITIYNTRTDYGIFRPCVKWKI
jgi:ABC-2 type transport system ATP-binding protein